MCLAKVDNHYTQEELKAISSGIGYKNVHLDTATDRKTKKKITVVGLYHGNIKLNKWYNNRHKEVVDTFDYSKKPGKDREYETGFHIFLSRKDAENYSDGTVVKVYFTNVKHIGKQDEENVSLTVIADKIKIVLDRKPKRRKRK